MCIRDSTTTAICFSKSIFDSAPPDPYPETISVSGMCYTTSAEPARNPRATRPTRARNPRATRARNPRAARARNPRATHEVVAAAVSINIGSGSSGRGGGSGSATTTATTTTTTTVTTATTKTTTTETSARVWRAGSARRSDRSDLYAYMLSEIFLE